MRIGSTIVFLAVLSVVNCFGQGQTTQTQNPSKSAASPVKARAAKKTAGQTPSPSSVPPSPAPPPEPAPGAPACPTADDKGAAEVVLCIMSGKGTKYEHLISMNSIIERGDALTVPIAGFRTWVDKKNDPHALRLYLAGHLLSNPEPSLIEVEQGYVNFQLPILSKDLEEKKAWAQILIEARQHEDRRVPITVGLPKGMEPFPSNSFIVVRVYPSYTAYVVTGLALLFIALIVLGWKSDLLRDTSRGNPAKPATAPFSLGRVQMAWWFFLVIAAYVYISLITKEINGLSPTVLALIGISAGTGLAAIFVDQQKLTDEANEKLSLQSEQSVVQGRIQQLTQANPGAGTPEALELQAKQKRLAEIATLLSKYPAVPVIPTSKGLIDIFKDGDGISFHRFQIAVWTIVLGLVFVRNVLLQLIMPDFDTTLLGLMGISSGTYIGFKFPEKQG